MHSLKKDAFMGFLWCGSNTLLRQFILFIVKLTLAKILIPEDFGLAAMAFILISVLDILNTFGTGIAYIRDNKNNEIKSKNTLFYLDALPNILIALFTFLLAPFVASFFSSNMPGSYNTLLWMMRAVALTRLFNLFSIVPNVTLTKEMKFDKQAISHFLGGLTYGSVAVILALLGFGPWAIIWAVICESFIIKIALNVFSPFFPRLIFDKKIAKQYLVFGINSFISSLISIVIINGDDALVGKLLGGASLGFYSLALHISGLIFSTITGIANQVLYPLFCKIQDDKKTCEFTFQKAFKLTTLFTIPGIFGLFVLSPFLIDIVLGESWMSMLNCLYILLIASLFNNISAIAVPVFNSFNKPEIIKNNRLIQLVFYILLIFPFTFYLGIEGTALVMVIFSLISMMYYFHHIERIIPGTIKFSLNTISKKLFASLIMSSVVYFLTLKILINVFTLIPIILTGVLIYFFFMWLFDRDIVNDLLYVIKFRR